MTAPGRRGLVMIGVAAYLVFVIVSFPAHVATRWLLPAAVQVSGVQGTLWRGSAAAVAVGPAVFGATQWRLRPLALFLGQLRADLDLRLADGALQGQASTTLGGTVRLRDVTGVIPLATLGGLIPTQQFDGRIGLDIESARVTEGWLVDANGTVDVVDLRMVTPVQEALGNFEVAFAGADDDMLDGAFREIQAPLKANGVLRLHANKSWELNGTVSTTPQTPAQLSQGLAFLPPGDRNGEFLLSLGGQP